MLKTGTFYAWEKWKKFSFFRWENLLLLSIIVLSLSALFFFLLLLLGLLKLFFRSLKPSLIISICVCLIFLKVNFYQKFKEELTPILLKLFQKIAEESKLANNEATITLITKPDKDATKKKKTTGQYHWWT